MTVFLLICSFLSLAYWGILITYAGIHTAFASFWLGLSILFGGLAFWRFYRKKNPREKVSELWIRVAITTTISTLLVSFVIIEGLILGTMFTKPVNDLDYIIVLGAQVRGVKVSPLLKNRLDTAYKYLEQNPDTEVIVSGGRGEGEYVSEAYAMATYLSGKGIAPDRIIQEKSSRNTKENIVNSKMLIGDKNAKVGIVTNDFHLFRSLSLAKKQGVKGAHGISASSDFILQMNYLVREFFAVLKDKIMGNI